jgi:hypothetical protein
MATSRTRKTKAPSPAPAFSPEEIKKILKLAKGSKSIEVKVTVALPEQRATLERIGLDPVEAEPRQAFFFDTPDLTLNQAGVVVRARRMPGGRADTVVKLRPVDPAMIDAELSRSDSFKIELDVMPGGFVCSASYKGSCTSQEVLDVADGKIPVQSLFSKEQRAFYEAHAPASIEMDSLTILGPTFLLKQKHRPKDFDRNMTIELWLYPDGTRILEISIKCLPAEAFQAGAEFKSYLQDIGVTLDASQETKTKTSLEFFKPKAP